MHEYKTISMWFEYVRVFFWVSVTVFVAFLIDQRYTLSILLWPVSRYLRCWFLFEYMACIFRRMYILMAVGAGINHWLLIFYLDREYTAGFYLAFVFSRNLAGHVLPCDCVFPFYWIVHLLLIRFFLLGYNILLPLSTNDTKKSTFKCPIITICWNQF